MMTAIMKLIGCTGKGAIMAEYALFIGWNRSVAGREPQAMDLFMRVMEYYGQLQNDGKIESFEPVVLSNHGGDLNGFVLLRGDATKLDEVRREETFTNFSIEANFCLENFGVIDGYIGDGITRVFSQWSTHFS
jgi:hypothetical protein